MVTVNFAFMKIFNFLVKKAIFKAFLLFLGDLRHALRPKSNTWRGQNLSTQISQKKEKCLKNSFFDWKIKNFHKSKVDGLQKLSTRASLFQDCLHFKGWPYINHKISLQFEHYFENFFASSYPFYDACSYGSTFKRVLFNEYFSSKIYSVVYEA